MKRSVCSVFRSFWLPWLVFLWILVPSSLFAATYGINSTNKYAWSESGGWVNFRPTQGGVQIFTAHLAGYAWGENIGLIALGVDGAGPYANTDATNWGVNLDANGTLSGYGWSETVGWINFNAFDTTTAPKILTTGTFSGYVWSSNVGWIRLSNTTTTLYKVARGSIMASLSGIADQTINEDEKTGTIAFTTGDTDPASTNFAVTASSSNTALIPNANLVLTGTGSSRNLVVTPAANQAGSAVITVTATSGNPVEFTSTKTFNMAVAPVNDAPVATNGTLTTNEDTAYTGTLSATDSDSTTLTYSIVTPPTKGSITITNAATGAFTYTPTLNVNGSDSFTFKVNDGALDSNIATMTVTVTPVNDAPVATNGTFTTNEDTVYTGTLSATDSDSTTLSYVIVTKPTKGSVVISAGSAFSYTPNLNANGSDSFTFKANDSTLDSNTATMTVTINPINDPPSISGVPSTGVLDNSPYSFIPSATDLENDPLTFSIQNKPVWATFNSTTGALTGSPAYSDLGSSPNIIISVSDGANTVSLPAFSITVTHANTPPTITKISDLTSREDDPMAPIALTVGDLETPVGTLTVTASSANTKLIPSDTTHLIPSGTGANRTLTLLPTPYQHGSSVITVTVNDGTLTANTTFTVTVTPVNHPPTLTGTPPTSAKPGVAYSFTPVANDVDGDPLSFTIKNMPPWATFNKTTGVFSGTPAAKDYGIYGDIVISVSSGSAPDTLSLPAFSLSVEDTSNPVAVDIADGIFKNAQSVTLTCQDEGSGCAAIYYTLDGSNPSLNSTRYTAPITVSANKVLKYIAVDFSGHSSEVRTKNFTIDTTPPQMTITDPMDGVVLRELFQITGTATDLGGTGVETVRLQITDGTYYFTKQLDGIPSFTKTPSWVSASSEDQWAHWALTTMINWTLGNTYTITAEATDKVGNSVRTTSRFTRTDKFLVSGTILDGTAKPLSEVSITFADDNNRISKLPSNSLGQYSWEMPSVGWSGKITPTKPGYTFAPAEILLTSVASNQLNKNFTATAVESEQDARAIIVAGGDLQDYLWPATNSVANFAYTVLRKKGISKQNIRYLSMNVNQDLDNDTVSDINGLASSATLQDAITNWAGGYVNSKKPLIIYMVDHGLEGQFLITKPRNGQADILTSAKLEEWLNALQTKTGAKVILIMDACYSGSFVRDLIPPKGMSRIVITSTDTKELAYFASGGDQSFSSFFWKHILMGKSLNESFSTSVQASRAVSRNQQNPIMDADSDGVYVASKDTPLVSTTYLGTPFFTAAVFPEITDSMPDSYMEETGPGLKLWVQLLQGASKIDRVWGVVVPPGTGTDSQEPITNLPILAMPFNPTTNRYEATFDSSFSGFKGSGQYVISFYAQANDADRWTSLPKSVSIQVGKDEFESDNTSAQASIIVINHSTPQRHNTHLANDADWVRFYAIQDVTYAIEAINLGKNADVVLELYDTDGVTSLMKAVNDKGFGGEEKITFTPQKEGVYFVKATQFGANLSGASTEYDLKIYRPYGPIMIPFVALLTNPDKTPMANAVIKTNGNETAITDAQGRFTLMTDTNNTTVDLTVNGVQSDATKGVQVTLSGKTLTVTVPSTQSSSSTTSIATTTSVPSTTTSVATTTSMPSTTTSVATTTTSVPKTTTTSSVPKTTTTSSVPKTTTSVTTTTTSVPTVIQTSPLLDVDQSGTVNATDGVLLLRKLNGASTIDTGVMVPTGQTNDTILATINAIASKLDVDHSGTVDATDGVLILRKLNGASTIDTGVMLPVGQTNDTVISAIDAIAK
ncbi:MAG: tandem-95 repeat protein [Magnetococcus sp. YQC-5]